MPVVSDGSGRRFPAHAEEIDTDRLSAVKREQAARELFRVLAAFDLADEGDPVERGVGDLKSLLHSRDTWQI